MNDDLLTVKQAAEYLSLTVAGVKHHLYNTGELEADRRFGQQLGFYKSTLDRFKESKRSPGRPPKESAAATSV